MDILQFIQNNIIVFLSIILIEGVLSIDNAAVLSGIVNRTLTDPVEQKKVFTYGMIGAFAFRGLSIFAISWLLVNPMLGNSFMLIGGLYLIYLFATSHGSKEVKVKETWLERQLRKIGINAFWLAVISVEFMDLVFSLDNMIAVVAMSKNLYIIIAAVFVGIIMMRFIAIWFTKLIKKYPALEPAAMWVIFLVGLKLVVSSAVGFASNYGFAPELTASTKALLEDHSTDLIFSGIMLFIFSIPFISREISVLLNNPKSHEVNDACKPVLESLESKSKIVEQLNEDARELSQAELLEVIKENAPKDSTGAHIVYVSPDENGVMQTVIDESVPFEDLEQFFKQHIEPLFEEDVPTDFEVDENQIITRGIFLGCKRLPDGSVEFTSEQANLVRSRINSRKAGASADDLLIIDEMLSMIPEGSVGVFNVQETAQNLTEKFAPVPLTPEEKAAIDYVTGAVEVKPPVKKRRVRATKEVRDAKKAKAASLPKGWVDATPMTEKEVGELETVKPSVTKDTEVQAKTKKPRKKKANVSTKQ